MAHFLFLDESCFNLLCRKFRIIVCRFPPSKSVSPSVAIPPASWFDFLCLEEGSLSHPIILYSSLSFQLIRFCLRIPRLPETLARPISFWLRLRLSKVRSRAWGSSCITSPLWSFSYSPILEWLKGRFLLGLSQGSNHHTRSRHLLRKNSGKAFE